MTTAADTVNFNEWTTEKIGCNLIVFRNENKGIAVFLEYDFNIKGFRELSEYLICNKYCYHNIQYNRNLPQNRYRYYRILSMIPIKTWQKAYELFN